MSSSPQGFALSSVVVAGFKSYRAQARLSFAPLGLNVICGSNGAGKSTVLDAVLFALGHGSSADVVCKTGPPSQKTWVELEFKRRGAQTAVITVRCVLKSGKRSYSLWRKLGAKARRGGLVSKTRLKDNLASVGISRAPSLYAIQQRTKVSDDDLGAAIQQAVGASATFDAISIYKNKKATLASAAEHIGSMVDLLAANVARVVASVTRTARIVALEAHAATQAKRAAALRRAIATQSHAVALTRKKSLTDRIVELRASSASTTQQTRVATATLEAATERASSADADQDGESAAVNTVAIQLRCVRLEAKVSSLLQQQRSTTSIRRKAEERLSGAQMSLAAAKCMHADSIAAVRSADRCAAYVAGIVDDHSRSRCTSSATDHVHWLRGSIAATTSSAADVARSISDAERILSARLADAEANATELEGVRKTLEEMSSDELGGYSDSADDGSRSSFESTIETLRRARLVLRDEESRCAAIEETVDASRSELGAVSETQFGSLARPIALFDFKEGALPWLRAMQTVVGTGLNARLVASVRDASRVLVSAQDREPITIWDISRLRNQRTVQWCILASDAAREHGLVDPLDLIREASPRLKGGSAVLKRLFRNVLLCEDDATAAAVLRVPRFRGLELCTKGGVRHRRGVLEGGSQRRRRDGGLLSHKFRLDRAQTAKTVQHARVQDARSRVAALEATQQKHDTTLVVKGLKGRESELVAARAIYRARTACDRASLQRLQSEFALLENVHTVLAREREELAAAPGVESSARTSAMRAHAKLAQLVCSAEANVGESNRAEARARAASDGSSNDAADAQENAVDLAQDDDAQFSIGDAQAALSSARHALEEANARTAAAQRTEEAQLAKVAAQRALLQRLTANAARVKHELQKSIAALEECNRDLALGEATLREDSADDSVESSVLPLPLRLDAKRNELEALAAAMSKTRVESAVLSREEKSGGRKATVAELARLKQQQREFSTQYATLRDTVDQLAKGTASVERRATASVDRGATHIGASFAAFFERLVPGKKARVTLHSGGKRCFEVKLEGSSVVMQVSALSGGEQTLLGMAWLLACATYRAAPFYLLDEVDAALDEGNQALLAALVSETVAKIAQVITVSHHTAFRRRAVRMITIGTVDGASAVLTK